MLRKTSFLACLRAFGSARSLSDLRSDKLLKQNGLQDPEESTDPMATKVSQTRVGACNGAFLRKFTSNFQPVLPLAACSKCYVRQAARATFSRYYRGLPRI